jgi:hypothetical protein
MTMNVPIPPSAQPPLPAGQRTWPGRLVTLATVIVVTAVAAATFVLSYTGVHAVALQSGVSVSLARYYPGVFDAVLVIACAAAPLRDAQLWTRLYTWLVIFLVVGILGAIDAVHAMNVALPHRQTAGVIAVLPWVLLLLAFGLWLAILRHFRVQQSRHLAAAGDAGTALAPDAGPAESGPAESGPEGHGDAAPAGRPTRPALPPAASEEAAPQAVAEPAPAAGDSAEGSSPADSLDGLYDVTPYDTAAYEVAPVDPGEDSGPADPGGPDQPGEEAEIGGIPFTTGPRLRRVRSLPVPPAEDEE